MSEINIDSLRSRIQAIDSKLLTLAAQRMELCCKVGEYKRDHNLPVKDFKVEKQIIEKTKAKARSLNIYPELAESLMKLLIEYSVLAQDEIKSSFKAGDSEAKKNILIIGGAGHMGQWTAHFFESLGHNIRINDDRVADSNRYTSEPNLHKGLNWAHITVLATPMEQTNQLLLDLISSNFPGIIVELCSLKSPIEEGLKAAKARGLRLVSIHPMFGPTVEILSGRNLIICNDPSATNQDDINEIESMFKLTSANILRVDLQEHDKLMSYILGSSHLINLIYGKLLASSALSFKDLQSLAGTTFSHQIQVTASVIEENSDLYFDIQKLNSETPELFKNLSSCIQQIQNYILKNQRDEFKASMMESAAFFRKN